MYGWFFLVLFVRNNGNALVVAAVLADAMSQHLLVALGAGDDSGKGELPIGAAGMLTSLGNFSFGESHDYTS